MHSALYQGWVRHHRRLPKKHHFTYGLSLFYLDLDELPTVLPKFKMSRQGFLKPLQFSRNDYLRPQEKPLKQAVLDLVESRLQFRPNGSVRLLTHPRIWGLCFNPVSFYYCFDADETLRAIVAEINNTPWDERFSYVLSVDKDCQNPRFQFEKDFHVSPFLPMAMTYHWRFGKPDQKLWVAMANFQQQEKQFSATLALRKTELSRANIRRFLWRSPFQTYRIVIAIYWQALKLWLKRTPFFDHPKHQKSQGESS